MLQLWLARFLFTQLIEVPIYSCALRGRALVAFGASAITHPFVFFVFPRFWPGSYWTVIAVAEIFAVAVEAAYLHHFKAKHALWWSLAANAASYSLARLSAQAFGWP